jgi:hypothetical protein
MNQGKLVFAQIMEHLPLSTFRRCVAHYNGGHKVKRFSCLDQYLCMHLRNSHGERACAISKPACEHTAPSSTISASAAM